MPVITTLKGRRSAVLVNATYAFLVDATIRNFVNMANDREYISEPIEREYITPVEAYRDYREPAPVRDYVVPALTDRVYIYPANDKD